MRFGIVVYQQANHIFPVLSRDGVMRMNKRQLNYFFKIVIKVLGDIWIGSFYVRIPELHGNEKLLNVFKYLF